MEYRLTTPCTAEDLAPLKAGDTVLDLGCEAVRRLIVKDMPLTVILDAHGGDLYQSGPAAYLEAK